MTTTLPAYKLSTARMPGHWLLARLGKRVLRPGGLGLTKHLLTRLKVTTSDTVVEFAPGLGSTACMLLQAKPSSYTGLEKDADAAAWSQSNLPVSESTKVVVGSAEQTGLVDGTASVIVGEAMLTMNTPAQKQRIVAEAFRVLKSGGRYGIHEMVLVPDDISAEHKNNIEKDLSAAIHVGARPLTETEWVELLTDAGFRLISVQHAAMHLLHVRRFIADEGISGTFRFAYRLLADSEARRRVLRMRSAFKTHEKCIAAVAIVAIKD